MLGFSFCPKNESPFKYVILIYYGYCLIHSPSTAPEVYKGRDLKNLPVP